jgi:hypothetical protein
MPTHRKARELAGDFENAYPETLGKRLEWWRHVLGIDKPRFLRMMGLSAEEASRQKDRSWGAILETKEWQENGWWVEGKLHELLRLFDYDWQALSARLHQAGTPDGPDLARVTRTPGDIAKLQYVPSGDGTDILLNQVVKGGPESFPALLAYLSGGPRPGARSS